MRDYPSNSDLSPSNEDLMTAVSSGIDSLPNSPRNDLERKSRLNKGPIQKMQEHWSRLGLRSKATLLAIVISTIPVLSIGSVAYYTASSALNEEARKTEKGHTIELADKVNRYMADRYIDIRAMADKAEFSDSKVRGTVTTQSRSALLNKLLKLYQVYDSIAVFDLNGNVLGQSEGEKLTNHRNYDYFKQAVNSGKAFVTVAQADGGTGEGLAFYAVSPIKDKVTQKTVGVIRARKPVASLTEVIETILSGEEEEYSLIGPDGTIFLSNSTEKIGTKAVEDIPKLKNYVDENKFAQFIGYDKLAGKDELVSYVPFPELKGASPLNWSALVEIPKAVVEAPQRTLLLEIAVGTLLMAVLVGAAASALTGRVVRPILDTSRVVEEIGEGELDARVLISGADEISILGENINRMAVHIQELLNQQAESAAREVENQAELARQQTEAAAAEASNQAELARQQTEAAEELKRRNEALQNDLVRLLTEVEGASDGDLTVRAEISDGDIGIIGDFFNSIIESLGDIVAQVKTSTAKVNASIGSNEETMGLLSDEAKVQAEKINTTLQSIEDMALSVQNVARNAQQAAEVAAQASVTAQEGGQTMDRTVESIQNLRETVSSTAKKVKRLGESSQQISKAVSLINQIALQTNLLAINASIEAARAGEEGRGFAVVAEEVGALAAQSASATKEIEQIVETIQQETGDVVDAMEQGTTQVVEGTRQVEEAKKSLQNIVSVSNQIDSLLKSISDSTVSQTVTSNDVKELMKQITLASERTYQTSQEVSDALRETVQVAQGLGASVDTFKVKA